MPSAGKPSKIIQIWLGVLLRSQEVRERGVVTMTLHRRDFLQVAAGAAALPVVSRVAWADQQKMLREIIVGTWMVVSVDNIRPDGSRFQSFGPNPKGIMMFDANGRFSFQMARAARPKFESNNRLQGTPEENRTTVQGSFSYYGTYAIDEADRTLHLYVEGSSYPNFEGIDNKRILRSLTEDEMKWYSPAGSIGTTAEVVWKRAK